MVHNENVWVGGRDLEVYAMQMLRVTLVWWRERRMAFAAVHGRSGFLALPHSARPTILRLTCWVCGKHPSLFEQDLDV